MSFVVVPPHRDPTLAPHGAGAATVVDVAGRFAGRVLRAEHVAGVAASARERAATPDELRALLLLEAAAELLRAPAGAHSFLRAAGAALAGMSGPPSTVRLTLDDLELARGTTESSAAIDDAAAGPAPYDDDVESAASRCRGAPRAVRVWIDADQQLPAAAAFARALGGGARVELCGRFASEHGRALTSMRAFAGAEIVDAPAPRWTVGVPGAADGVEWRDGAPRRPRPWGGPVPLPALLDPAALVSSGCRVAVVSFCAAGHDVVAADGARVPATRLHDGWRALRDDGVRVVGEWLVGAPGIGLGALDATLDALDGAPFFDWLAGLRRFSWPARAPGGRWGATHVDVGDLEPGRDLARTRPFSAPGTPSRAEVEDALERLARAARARAPLSPGRVAGAYATPPDPAPARGDGVSLDPDCAVVELPRALDGGPGPAWYAANLRMGSVVALDGRVARRIKDARAPARPGALLAGVPDERRARLVDALVGKHVLVTVGA